MSEQGERRALVTLTLAPFTTDFRLTPPAALSAPTGYQPPTFNLVPPLTLGDAGSGLATSPQVAAPPVASSASPATPADASTTSGGGKSTWQTLAQAVVQINPANASFSSGVPAPAPAQ